MRYSKGKISIISIYVNDFLLASNNINIFEDPKKLFTKEYNTKDLGKTKLIIKWQIHGNLTKTMKIDQSVFIHDLMIDERLTKYNANIILIQAGFSINMIALDNYEKADLRIYQ